MLGTPLHHRHEHGFRLVGREIGGQGPDQVGSMLPRRGSAEGFGELGPEYFSPCLRWDGELTKCRNRRGLRQRRGTAPQEHETRHRQTQGEESEQNDQTGT